MTNRDQPVDDWINRAKSLVDYHSEARGFLSRASAYFPVTPEDAEAICLLWVQADSLDEELYGSLVAMNEGLLEGAGEIVIATEPRSQNFTGTIQSSRGGESLLTMPIQTGALRQALTLAYYRAMTATPLT